MSYIPEKNIKLPVELPLSGMQSHVQRPQVEIIDLRVYWATLKRRKLLIFLLAVLCTLAAGITAFSMTPIYRSGVTIQMEPDTAQVLDFDIEANITGGGKEESFFSTQYEILKSKALAKRTIDKLGLEAWLRGDQLTKKPWFLELMAEVKIFILDSVGLNNNDEQEGFDTEFSFDGDEIIVNSKFSENISPDFLVAEEPAEKIFLDNLSIEPVRKSRVVKVFYESPDPQLSANVANALAENYINMNLERRRESASYAENFLQTELDIARSKLNESEQKAVAFARQESIIRMGQSNLADLDEQRLSELNRALAQAEEERITAESKVSQASAQADMEVLKSPTVQELKKSRAELQGQYYEQLQTYKEDYPFMLQLQSQLDTLDVQINQEVLAIQTSVLGSLEADQLSASARERELQGRFLQQREQLLDLRDKSVGYNTLQREVEVNRNLYEGLLQRIKEIGVAGGIGVNNISIIDSAVVPYEKSKPKITLIIALGLAGGIGLGVMMAFLLEALDDSIRTPDDLKRLSDYPNLGLIPLDESINEIERTLISDVQPNSAMAEAFRSLRTNLMFSARNGLPKSLIVTSSRPSESKSTSIMNLAIVLGQAGTPVLVVDADLRKPTVHKRLKLSNVQGLSSILTGQTDTLEAIQKTQLPLVDVITAGPNSPNPAELLTSDRMENILQLAPEKYQIILFDCCPTLGLADALILANRTEAALLVVAAEESSIRAVQDAKNRLEQAQANIIGTLFGKIPLNTDSGYYYQQYYQYGAGGR